MGKRESVFLYFFNALSLSLCHMPNTDGNLTQTGSSKKEKKGEKGIDWLMFLKISGILASGLVGSRDSEGLSFSYSLSFSPPISLLHFFYSPIEPHLRCLLAYSRLTFLMTPKERGFSFSGDTTQVLELTLIIHF